MKICGILYCRIMDYNIREARIQNFNRYYYTPSRLYKIGAGRDDPCWKFQQAKDTLIHALWECQLVFQCIELYAGMDTL